MFRHQQQVREFHEKFGLPFKDKPSLEGLTEKDLKLRCALLLEETLEFCFAAGFKASAIVFSDGKVQLDIVRRGAIYGNEPNLVGMADALADIQYVNDGAAVTLGIDLEPLGDEVHRSNMTKLWDYCTLCQIYIEDMETVQSFHYKDPDHPIIKKPKTREDGKKLKPPSYSPANIEVEIQRQQGLVRSVTPPRVGGPSNKVF